MKKVGSDFLRELIRALVRNLGVLEKTEVSCCGTTISQCHAIVEVGLAGEISLNELAELLVLDKSTMSRTINNLVEADFVERELHSDDRRYVSISLSDNGKEVFKTIENSMGSYYKTIFESIPEEKRSQVIESLELLIEAVKKNKCC